MSEKEITIRDVAELCGSGRFRARVRSGGEIIMEDLQTGAWVNLSSVQSDSLPRQAEAGQRETDGNRGLRKSFTDDQGPYRGFLMVKCEVCGKIKGFCAKRETYSYRCDSCGGITLLEKLRPMHMKCKCGKEYTYKTNLTDQTVTYPCVTCHAPVDMELNWRGTTYVTITERG